MFCPSDFSAFPWLEFAWRERGVRGVRGRRDNARVVAYLATVGLGDRHDETPWCSAFVNWCMEQASIRGTGRANARSWLNWGGMCLGMPHYGCVTILWRERRSSRKGHVGFYMGSLGNRIYLLGGNQSNSVRIGLYARKRILGYRWPADYPLVNVF